MMRTRQREKDDGNGINFIAEEIGQLSFSSICWIEFSQCSLLFADRTTGGAKDESKLDFIIWTRRSSMILCGVVWMILTINLKRKRECRKMKKGNWVCREEKWEAHGLLFGLGRLQECGVNWDKLNIGFLEQLQLVEKFTYRYHFRMNLDNYKYCIILTHSILSLTFLRKFVWDSLSDRWT